MTILKFRIARYMEKVLEKTSQEILEVKKHLGKHLVAKLSTIWQQY